MADVLKAPFPAFGGKSKVAPLVWQRLGDVDNFIEPFCNSCAVLLQRPHAARIETVNDWDCHVANFWRATAFDPGAVACFADNPVNEADLHARHRFLVLGQDAAEFRQRMRTDPHYFDVRFAGYWVWGACCWIGSGWCVEPSKGELSQQIVNMEGRGVTAASGPHLSQQIPFIARYSGSAVPECSVNPHKGLIQQLPFLSAGAGTGGRGINSVDNLRAGNRPQLADAFSRGRGVNGNDSAGTCQQRRDWLVEWFNRLRDRFRTVRVCCGDWQRVCDSYSTTTRLGTTGIFLDAPYKTTLEDGKSNRADGIYASDRDQNVNALVDRVIKFCIDRGGDPDIRIAACCYEGEGYEILRDFSWTVESWKAGGGYGNHSGKVNENAGRERIWFSPHCRQPMQKELFAPHELN